MITQKTSSPPPQRQDLEERLLAFAVRIVGAIEGMKNTPTSGHVREQLLRSGILPYTNHVEGGAESRDDFIQGLKICYKGLRETYRWLKLAQRAELIEEPAALDPLLTETDQLIRIFSASLRTARENDRIRAGQQT